MLQQLRSHSLSLQILLPLLAVLPYVIFIFNADLPDPVIHNAQGWLYHKWSLGITSRPWLFMALGWMINLLTAFSLYWLNIRFEVCGRRTVYISYLFGMIVLAPMGFHYFHPGMLGGLIVIFSLIFIFLVYHSSQTQAYIYNSGLFWGIAVLIYPPFIVLLPVYILSARYVKSTSFKDFLLLFTGFFTPVLIWMGLVFLKGEFRFQWLSLQQWFEFRKSWPPDLPGYDLIWYLFLGYIILMLFLNFGLYRVKKDVGRRVLTIIGQLIWVCPLAFLLFERVFVGILWFAMIPVAVMVSVAAFYSRDTWKADLIFIGFFLFMLAFQLNLIV